MVGWSCSSKEIIGSSYRTPDGMSGAAAGGTPGVSQVPGEAGSNALLAFATNYDEPYRGQFHFSPPGMWMDVIDGVWYDDGTYHLTYQAVPSGFVQGQDEHWGHATSPDLVHWTPRPFALSPGVNVNGEAWAGSVVVDTANTSGLTSGSGPVYVAVYTATGIGTSLAYSNDRGQTWQAYADNPLAIGDANYRNNRDPVVTWHAPSRRWVCTYWEHGITFYTSPDLVTWTRGGNFNWGQLVPDFYELAIDDDPKQTRWVLADASGAYFTGQFDGQAFTPDPGGPYAMDVGPSFFAARTSFRPTFPNQRAVQIAWMKDNGVASAPARGNATFPAELELKTFPEGVRLTRTPIAEIRQLYANQRHFEAQSLGGGKNLLAGIESKTFDLEVVVDAATTSASKLRLQIANKSIDYDFKAQTLLGKPLPPLDGHVTLRVLVDWGQLEVFGNEGELSYTESFGFTPGDATLALTADAPLTLISADFRELKRAWPGTAAAASRILDDASPATVYEGDWSEAQENTYFQNTAHVSSSQDAALEATFTGTRVDWYGLVNTDLGMVDVYLDGVLSAAVDCYSPTRAPVLLFLEAGLPDTFHTIRLVASGRKNAASSGTAMVHDYFVYFIEK